jgi:PAS domain-containing protein
MSESSIDNRIRVLRGTELLDSPPERAFDRLTRLASGLLGAPIALLSLVDERRQFFKSTLGLSEPWASRRETPLTHSFCQYATRSRAPLIVDDARLHPLLRENRAIRDLNVIAYAGIPLIVEDEAIGALCVVDDVPRTWSKADVRLLSDLAESAVSEIELRIALRTAREQRALMDALIESVGDAVLAVDTKRTFLLANGAARSLFVGPELGKSLPPDWARLLGSFRTDGSPLPPEEGALGLALRGESTTGLQFTVQRPGVPEPVWVEANGRPVRGADGAIVAAVAVYRDVTEKKREADLYAALAANIPRGAVALFDHELRCLAVDGTLTRRDGIIPAAMAGKPMRALALAMDPSARGLDGAEAAYQRALGGQSSSLDVVLGNRTLALHVGPVQDSRGRVSAGIVLGLDVTHERRTEAALRQSEQIYRAIVQHLPNGAVLLADRHLVFVSADGPAIGDLVRRTNQRAIVGQTVADLAAIAADVDRAAVIVAFERALEGEPGQLEVTRDDRFYDLRVLPVFDGARPSHALALLSDVTARKQELLELANARAALAISRGVPE